MLKEMKGAFDTRGAVGIALFMRPEDEAEAVGEGRHLGAATIRAPVPAATTTCVLSIMHVAAAPPRYSSASVRKTLQ